MRKVILVSNILLYHRKIFLVTIIIQYIYLGLRQLDPRPQSPIQCSPMGSFKEFETILI